MANNQQRSTGNNNNAQRVLPNSRRLAHFVLILIGTVAISTFNFYQHQHQHHHHCDDDSVYNLLTTDGVPAVLPNKPAEWTTTRMDSSFNQTYKAESSSPAFRILQPTRTTTTSTTASSSSSSSSPLSVCQQLLQTSPLAVWIDHIDIILEASRLPRDKSFKLRDKTAHALQLITSRLNVAQKAWSQQHAAIANLVDKLQQHVDYYTYYHFNKYSPNNNNNNTLKDPPKPIQIVVLGGSVTAGINCFTGVPGSDIQKCAWSARLESILKHLLMAMVGHRHHHYTGTTTPHDAAAAAAMVQVHNLAMSGTNTATGNALWNYDMFLLPQQVPNNAGQAIETAAVADIVINAYATNDMHIQSVLEAANDNMTLRDKVFDMSQDFVRTVMKSTTTTTTSCGNSTKQQQQQQQPLLIWLDDYLGNEQREILATTEYAQGLSVLSNYYGFSLVSYADAVRSWVYGDTHEGLFSPGYWYKSPTARKMQREIHPSQGMHMSTAWLLAYHLLELTHQHCTKQAWDTRFVETPNDLSFWKNVRGLSAAANQQDKPWPSPPKNPPRGLPPRLTTDLRLDQVSDAWKQNSEQAGSSECSNRNDSGNTNPNKKERRCPFTWASGIHPNPQIKSRQEAIEQVFAPHIIEQNGWELKDETGRGDRIGWIASQTMVGNSTLVLEWNREQIPNLDRIQTIGLFFLKSYGTKWVNSSAIITIEGQDEAQQDAKEWTALVAAPHVLSGFHDKKTSEMYSKEITLIPSQSDRLTKGFVRTKLRITFELKNGTTFKLLGLAVCR